MSANEPTVEELVANALDAGVIDQELAEELQGTDDVEEAISLFYTYAQVDNPRALLQQWNFIEMDEDSATISRYGLHKVANRLLRQGAAISYDEVVGELHEGQVLVATWLRTPQNKPVAHCVIDRDDFASIADKAKHGYYNNLCWFASITGSEDPAEYNALG